MSEHLDRQVRSLGARADWLEYMVIALAYEVGILRSILEPGQPDPYICQGAVHHLDLMVAVCNELVQGDDELSRKAGELLGG